MKAAILRSPLAIVQRSLQVEETADLQPQPGQVLLRVRACGVCRTDLHIVKANYL